MIGNFIFMCHTFLVLTVKKWLKSVYIYGSYRKIETGVSLFWTTLYTCILVYITMQYNVWIIYWKTRWKLLSISLLNHYYYCYWNRTQSTKLKYKSNRQTDRQTKNHAVQIHLIAIAISTESNSPVHWFGWSLNNNNMSFNTSTLANSSDDLVDK